jgi:DegV family protein with EDD domain
MSICILTDNTASLPSHSAFPGQRLIKSLPLRVENQHLSAPTVDAFLRAYHELESKFNAILVLTTSKHLLPGSEAAGQAATQHGGTVRISVLDSQQTGTGLGILAQIGAQAAAAGHTLTEIEAYIRAAIPHLYTLVYAEAEYLARNGLLFPAPADGSAVLGPFPLFILEDGQLSAYKKVRTKRHLLESFEEFIQEFERPQQITLLHGAGNTLRTRPLREMSRELFPETRFNEIELSAPLDTLFGPQAMGITLLEMPKCPSAW